ncbi:hypothetical protein ACFX1T_009344 [Malus domestica]
MIWALDSILADFASHQGVAKGSKKAVQQAPSKSHIGLRNHGGLRFLVERDGCGMFWWWSAFGGRDSKSCPGVLLESSKKRDNSTRASSTAKAQGCLSLPAECLKKRCPSLCRLFLRCLYQIPSSNHNHIQMKALSGTQA